MQKQEDAQNLPEFNPDSVAYELSDLHAPVMSGIGLGVFIAILRNSSFVQYKVISDSNGFILRQRQPTEVPTYYPYLPLRAAAKCENIEEVDLSKLVKPELRRDSGFSFDTIGDFHNAYLQQRLTPEDVAKKVIEAIKESNANSPPLKAIIASDEEDILLQARQSTERYKTGKPLSVLDGVPVAVKDEINQAGYRTTVGTIVFGKQVETEDATTVKKLRSSGALLIGKANMHEIGIGTNGANVHYGPARNPYNLHHHTGGSSSGSAAVVAAGICPLSVGADGGGSIRIPSALCGVVGLKCTWGRVSEHGAFTLCPTIGHIGPIANNARDCAIGYMILAGEDEQDSYTTLQPQRHLRDFENDNLSGLTIGIYDKFFNHADPIVVSKCRNVVDFFVSQGAKIRPIAIPSLEEIKSAHLITILTEMLASMRSHLGNDFSKLSYTTQGPLHLAEQFNGPDYHFAQRIRTRAIKSLETIFDNGVDVIAAPASAIPAPPITESVATTTDEINATITGKIMRHSVLANLTGVPAISFPAGYTSEGLPVSLQLIAKWYDEHILLRLARVAEKHVVRAKPAYVHKIL